MPRRSRRCCFPSRSGLALLAVLAGPYPQGYLRGAAGALPLDLAGSAAGGDLRLLTPSGPLPLAAVHALAPGAAVACTPEPGERTGPTTGINLGVFARSDALLLDATWLPRPPAAWAALAARGAVFDNWENCGIKPEGPPSPASRLAVRPDGGTVEDVFDGNPGTNLNIIRRTLTPRQVMARLASGEWRLFARHGRTVLLWRGRGFLAAYLQAG